MKRIINSLILTVFLFNGCKKDNNEINSFSFSKSSIGGNSQKGPFLNGSSVTLFELNANYSQTGKSFTTQISDNLGSFQINNIEIQTQFAKLKADGYYFNEVSNSYSTSPISLYAISDLSDKNTINVNLLTTLEVSRIEYLISNGWTFNAAKLQSQSEILNIFSIQENGIPDSELLDISKDGDNNAILLAISLILQGYRTEAELTQLLGDINSDIRTDGVLNSPTLGTALINDAKLLSLPAIRSNIENKYFSLGIATPISNFEKYINQFIDSTNYIFSNYITYPFIVNTKQNLLKDSVFVVSGGTPYSIGAYLPTGSSLKIVAKGSSGYNMSGCGIWSAQNIGWTINNFWPDSMIFSTTGSDQTVDVPFQFGSSPNSIDFAIYENNTVTPTRIKTITF